MHSNKKAIIILVGLLFPSLAMANGGLPIIFLINAYAFIVGAVIVLLLESIYLKTITESVTLKQVIACVFIINVWSSLFGIIVIPILIMLAQLEPIFYMVDSKTTEEKMSLIWWLSFSVDLIVAYVGTVFIEYKLIKNSEIFHNFNQPEKLLGSVLKFNLLSYLSLVLLVWGTIIVGIK